MRLTGGAAPKILKGIPVSSGIVIGKAHVVETSHIKIVYQYLLDEKQVEREVERFLDAIHATGEQLKRLKEDMPEPIKSHGFIIDTHLMILQDSMLRDATVEKIRNDQINAEWALRKSLREIRRLFEKIEDPYIRGRIDDVEDVTDRIMRNLAGQEDPPLGDITQRVIVVAHKLSPADTSEMDVNKVMGFITDMG
ncbi:MAG TPA: phosphoenolpyruvate--protein phosphotransferase, partial [Desulfobacterales bacterium]|nr:phosphoenolpyruvate--protein phosphotransferase [Desulfobacterales bacterium]